MATTPDIAFERGLPASVDAERTILGAILLDNHAYNEAAEKLVAADFALESHQRIFARIGELMDASRAVDIVTLAEQLAKRKEVESIGGVAYLASLTEGLPRRLSIEEYVRIVKDKSLLRQLINICSMSITRAADQSEDALEILNQAESDLLEVTEKGITRGFAGIPPFPARLNLLERVELVVYAVAVTAWRCREGRRRSTRHRRVRAERAGRQRTASPRG